MWNRYPLYLDYLALRRRVERQLSSSRWLFIHVALFVIIPQANYGLWPWGWWYPERGPEGPYPLVHNWIAVTMIGWSVLLALHGLLTFFRSGAWGNSRDHAIESEMRRQVQQDDSHLISDARDLFRLHGLLEDDIQRRSGITVTLLTLFTLINAFLWITTQGGLYSAVTWWLPALMALILLPILTVNRWRLRQHERRIRDLMASDAPFPAAKQKRDVLHLGEDGELLEIVDDDYEKPKRAAR